MTPETPKQPEEMPETTYPEELFIECRFTDDGDINRITFGNVRYIRADLAAKPDKVDVDVAQAALTNLVNGRTLESDHRIAATRIIKAHLNTRNLIPPVEPVRGDADMDNLADIYIRHTKPDRIQGFYYKPFHVIRDVFKKSDEQEIFRLHEDEPAAREIYEKQHERECVKVGLRRVIAALTQFPAPDNICEPLAASYGENAEEAKERGESPQGFATPSPDLDKIVESVKRKKGANNYIEDEKQRMRQNQNDKIFNAGVIAAIEAVKQARG